MSRLLPFVAVAFLAACSGDHKWATDAQVAQAAYVAGPPASVTLITSINGHTHAGAHSAIIINGSQRVLYDPAGSWELANGAAPERKDLHYGMNPSAVASYLNFQAQGVFYVVSQTIDVPQSVADQVIADAVAHGSAPSAFCTQANSSILRAVPGFESLPATFFPKVLSHAFGKLPGVEEITIQGPEDGPVDPSATAVAGAVTATN
ncbi:MAG: hypothetical protein ACOH2H_08035 [Cypionkella sp.]